MQPIRAKALQPGATVAFISPSLRLNNALPDCMSRASNLLTTRGYQVRTFYTPTKGIQSDIAVRRSEIRDAFFDPSISAIICTIGGSTFTELIPALVADKELQDHIHANPKIFVGYSDITGFHWFLHKCTGLRTFYGPGAIPELGDVGPLNDQNAPLAFSEVNLFKAIASQQPIGDLARSPKYAPLLPPFLFGQAASMEAAKLVPTAGWQWLRRGKSQGRLFGGCLTVVARLQGIQSIAPNWQGRIVFLETAVSDDLLKGNPIERVQAAFADLIAQGVFDNVAGLVVGRPYGYNTDEERKQYADVITGLLCEGSQGKKSFPILFNIDIGHSSPMVTLPYDAMAVLDSDKDQFAILESGVE